MQDIHSVGLKWEYRNLIHNKKEIDCEKSYGKYYFKIYTVVNDHLLV